MYRLYMRKSSLLMIPSVKLLIVVLLLLISGLLFSSCTTQEKNRVNLLPHNRPKSWEASRSMGTQVF